MVFSPTSMSPTPPPDEISVQEPVWIPVQVDATNNQTSGLGKVTIQNGVASRFFTETRRLDKGVFVQSRANVTSLLIGCGRKSRDAVATM